jgi:hypothetical protein
LALAQSINLLVIAVLVIGYFASCTMHVATSDIERTHNARNNAQM